MKRIVVALALILVLMIAMLTACKSKIDYSLPDNPIPFNITAFANPSNVEDEYAAIEYEGRTYIPFGTLRGSIGNDDIKECLGYLVQDGKELEGIRVFTLTADSETNYLLEVDTDGEMSQPNFYRAVDTVGKNIETPSFVEALDYRFWD